MEICVLASGSRGNCTVVSTGSTRILIDAGVSYREINRRLGAVGIRPDELSAVCLTHAHSDHKSGLGVLHRRLGIPVYGNAGTIDALERDRKLADLKWNVFTTGSGFRVGDLDLEPFSVPHDCYDPVGFIVRGDGKRVGIVTDMGTVTELIRVRLQDCHALVVESNHDEAMLRDAPRPWSLKQRIMGMQGHLSNTQAGELLAQIAGPALQTVLLAHLSEECNDPGLAAESMIRVLHGGGWQHVAVKLTYADRASDVVRLG